jgi:hypothetical protein
MRSVAVHLDVHSSSMSLPRSAIRVRTFVLWACGLLASGICGGLIGLHFNQGVGSIFGFLVGKQRRVIIGSSRFGWAKCDRSVDE